MLHLLTFLLLSLSPADPDTVNWTNYRGPGDEGHAFDANLPTEWSEDKNIAWKIPTKGKAWSSPVIWGDRLWFTDAPPEGTRLSVHCVDKNTGKKVYDKKLHTVVAPQYCHPFNSYASPSPVLEEGRVYVSFGSPYTGCLDMETGDVIWERKDFVCNHFRGAGSSPFIYQDLLILHFDGSDHQFVVGLNKNTGETVWRTDRSVDYQDIDPETGKPGREGDMRKAYSTPTILNVGGKDQLLSLGSMALYAYEPETGKEIWRAAAIGAHSGSTRPVAGERPRLHANGFRQKQNDRGPPRRKRRRHREPHRLGTHPRRPQAPLGPPRRRPPFHGRRQRHRGLPRSQDRRESLDGTPRRQLLRLSHPRRQPHLLLR